MNDIIPPEKRTIRNIPINKKPAPIVHRAIPDPESGTQPEELFEEPEISEKKHSIFFYIAAILIPILIIAIVLGGYSIYWSGADVSVTARTQSVDINVPVRASLDSTDTASPLHVAFVTKTLDGSVDVPASGQEMVTKPASGQIIVYNTYSAAPQKLITNTRFQTSDGKIYRIHAGVTVPGRTTKSGKVVAGSVVATVYADAPGESYNVGLVDFTIPGFKGDPRYQGIYARSKTEMTGGMSGMRPKISDSDIKVKTGPLIDSLKDSALAGAISTSSADTIALQGGIILSSHESGRTMKDASTATVNESVDVQVLTFSKAELSSLLVSQAPLTGDKTGAYIKDFSGLSVVISSSTSPVIPNTLSLTISGTTTAVWYYNAEKLSEDLAGLPKDGARNVLAKYAGIQTAESIVRPFWKTSFPTDPKKIRIIDVTGI